MAVITGTNGPELIDGTSDPDTLEGLGGNDTINGGDGDDVITGGLGADLIDGGDGNDTISASNGTGFDTDPVGAPSDTIFGGAGDDTITGFGNTTMIFGGSGNDNLQGGPDGLSDTLDGGTGADDLIGQGGADVYIVDSVLDFVAEFEYDSYAPGTTNATGDVDEIRSTVSWFLRAWNDDGFNVENLTLLGSASINATGNEVANVVTGNSGDNLLQGLANDDTMDGAAGDDTLDGGEGDDELTGGSGADSFVFNTLSGDDTVTDYEDGTDTLDFSAFSQAQIDAQTRVETGGNTVISIGGITVTLEGFIAPPPAPVFDYIIEGTDNSERLTGDEGPNAIFGYDGNDTIVGEEGDDLLYDGQGIDNLQGGAGDDFYIVGSETDRITESAGGGNDTVVSYGEDYVLPSNVENLTIQTLGDLFKDGLAGTNTRDAAGDPQRDGFSDALDSFDAAAFYARESENFFNVPATMSGSGNSLDNVIIGNALSNALVGNDGNDTIEGGLGPDAMAGGAGNDVFRYTSFEDSSSDADKTDLIIDFEHGSDKIDLTGLLTQFEAVTSVNQLGGLFAGGLTFRDTSEVTGAAGEVYSVRDAASGVSLIVVSSGEEDRDDLGIFAVSTQAFSADDFILSNVATDISVIWDSSDTIAQFGPGLTTTWDIGSGFTVASTSNFGIGDRISLGTDISSDNGLPQGVSSISYALGDNNAAGGNPIVFGTRVQFSTASADPETSQTTAQSVDDQGPATEALVLQIDRDLDGTVDFDLTLNGDYTEAQFRTEYINGDLVLSLYDGNSDPTGALALNGQARVFETFTADSSRLFDRDGILLNTVSYQWYQNGEAIAGATGESYDLQTADIGKVINVEMTYTDDFGTTETVLSDTSLPIGVANLPATGSVTIEGFTSQGNTLTINTTGVSDPNFADPTTATYQWLRDGVDITGANGTSYTLVQGDVGARISVEFRFQDFSGGSEFKVSAETSAINNANDRATGLTEITGKVVLGETLGVDLSQINDLDGLTGLLGNARYVWLRDGTAIAGATAATYVVAEADLAADISVRVNFDDDLGGAEAFTSRAIRAPIAGETQQGTPDVDDLAGTAGEDILNGLASDDRLSGGASDDMLDGGEGLDTAVFAGAQTHYTVTLDASGVTVEDRRDADAGGQGTDALTNMEFLDFGTEVAPFGGNPVDLTQFGNVASLSASDFTAFIELYIAYFNRAPDAIGLFFWGTALEKGLSLEEIATLFFDQDETRATYPFLNDVESFAKQVYSNVLGREFDQAGLDFWVGVLSNGSVGLPTFMLEIIRGAKAAPQPGDSPELTAQKQADVAYLSNKTDLGAYFSVIKGMSDVDNARAAMDLYNGSQDSIDASKAAIDQFYDEAVAADGGEFLFTLSGVVDDPFAIF